MALIEARKRMDVVGLDISEQPDSPFVLMYHDVPYAIDHFRISTGFILHAYRGDQVILSFNARKAAWLVVRRSVIKFATKEELLVATAEYQKLQESVMSKLYPEEYRVHVEQKRRSLGLDSFGPGREPGQYI